MYRYVIEDKIKNELYTEFSKIPNLSKTCGSNFISQKYTTKFIQNIKQHYIPH